MRKSKPSKAPGVKHYSALASGAMCTIDHIVARSEDHAALLVAIASRVRARRNELGFTLQEVAAVSGVSVRFLIALEGGRANVSVVTLAAVAAALETSLVTLLPSDPPRAAPAATRPLSLIGLRGAGKSTVGARAAKRLGRAFIELDEHISERAGMTAGAIFDVHGAEFYRRIEREEIERVLEHGGAPILATAGSLVTHSGTYERLLATTTVVWLKASPEDHLARVIAQGDMRPMADRKDAMADLKGILRARRALYERAHHVVDTSKLGLLRSISRVVEIARR